MVKDNAHKRKHGETACYVFNDADLTGRTHVAHVDRVLEKRFRTEVQRENVLFTVPPAADQVSPPVPPLPHLNFSSVIDDDASLVDIAAWAQSRRQDRAKKKTKVKDGSFATLEHDPVLTAWALEKDKFLLEFARLQGLRGADPNICPRCTSQPSATTSATHPRCAEYRCKDCSPAELLCRECFVHLHILHPFHRVERYTGRDFAKTTLQEIGLVIQLGHPPYERCPSPAVAPRSALVLHTNGHHPVNLLFCNCDHLHKSSDRVQQLLRAELYPATLTDPTTYCTFRMLEQYLYATIIAIDANFRLKRRAVSNDARDPALGSGWGYFVEDGPYREHILKYVDQQEISTCTGFSALMHANTKFSKGYACTGVVGDLQKGERYCNMDYIVASTLSIIGPQGPLVLSYDIACQWAKYLRERLREFPDHLRISLPCGEVRYAIPKYHYRAHKEVDHSQYSLNLMPGVGLSDGEEIERNWPRHDGTQASIREMGPGSRHDTLEDHFGWANWTKLVTLGSLYRKRTIKAAKELLKQTKAFEEFEEGLQPRHIAAWTAQVELFEDDNTKPDPYYVAPSGLTETDIRLKLAEEEDVEAAEGNPSLHKVTPSAMLAELLEIEDAQRRFIMKYTNVGGDTQTPHQAIDILEKRAALRKRLAAIRDVQAIYMPCVPQLVARYHLGRRTACATTSGAALPRAAGRVTRSQSAVTTADVLELTETQPLFLPHSLSLEDLDACHPGLAEMEERLREGQMCSSLDKLRIHLHIKSRLVSFKDRHIRHQRANTRARNKILANELKIISFAEKYRAARQARISLNPVGEWSQRWRELRREDVRCMQDDDPSVKNGSESRRQVSWIWKSADSNDEHGKDSSGMVDALRVEYLRTRARARRIQEEVKLLAEERRRILVSLEKSALDWDRREGESAERSDCPITQQGLAAYAAKQAKILRALAAKFQILWTTSEGADHDTKDSADEHGDHGHAPETLSFEDDGDDSDSSDSDDSGDDGCCDNDEDDEDDDEGGGGGGGGGGGRRTAFGSPFFEDDDT
ncbi:hypothetical protein EIP86_004036 [Pleurotus ostreatoroseus]|nr:hypothetical protein EIP86_004036 [Pleurotus ostreatoroseus]